MALQLIHLKQCSEFPAPFPLRLMKYENELQLHYGNEEYSSVLFVINETSYPQLAFDCIYNEKFTCSHQTNVAY